MVSFEVIESFLGWVFDALAGLFSGLLGWLTFNPLDYLGNPVNGGLISCINFVNRFIPVKNFFAVIGTALPWFVLLVVAGMIWRWVRGL